MRACVFPAKAELQAVIMFPKKNQFADEVHDAIEYLINEWDFGFNYI